MELAPVTRDALADDGTTTVRIRSDADIVAARQQGRLFVLHLGFSLLEATLVATAISELARNIVLYAQHGEIVLRPLERDGKSGVLVIAKDDGPGIAEPPLPEAEEPSPRRLGLRGMKRLMDDLEIESGLGRGTTVAVRKWKG